MKKLIKIGIAIIPIFIIGHFTQNWPFVYGGLTEFALFAVIFFQEIKR